MHTHVTQTAPRAIYWTTQAQEVFAEEIRLVVPEHWTPGGQIVVGAHSDKITRIARRQGLERVNRALVQEYFARLADGGRGR